MFSTQPTLACQWSTLQTCPNNSPLSYHPLQVGSMCSRAPCSSLLNCSFLFFFFPSFHPSPLVPSSSSGISDYITNRWDGVDFQGHWVCEGSWLMLPTESIPCQFEWVPALILLELSSTPAGAQILPVPSRWITETLFSWLSIPPPPPPPRSLLSEMNLYQHSLYSNFFSYGNNFSLLVYLSPSLI